jgi:hypothetical protein
MFLPITLFSSLYILNWTYCHHFRLALIPFRLRNSPSRLPLCFIHSNSHDLKYEIIDWTGNDNRTKQREKERARAVKREPELTFCDSATLRHVESTTECEESGLTTRSRSNPRLDVVERRGTRTPSVRLLRALSRMKTQTGSFTFFIFLFFSFSFFSFFTSLGDEGRRGGGSAREGGE